MSKELLSRIQKEQAIMNLPHIPKELYAQLPEFLQRGVERFESSREKEVYLIGALCVLSGCIQKTHGIYDQRKVYPNLYGFVIAPPASGKGVMAYAKMLGSAYHAHLQNESMATSEVKPNLFIPGNASASAVIESLHKSSGRGIICEAEADTLANSFNQDWGNFSDLLRSAFQHESIGSLRKGEGGYIGIDEPMLSIALSGTPGQVRAIVPSAENGLFSRFLYYLFTATPEWRDVSPKEGGVNNTEFFSGLAERVLRMVRFSGSHPSEFTLTREQWEHLNVTFKGWLKETYKSHGMEATSITKRLGLMTFRIGMILSALRKFDCNNEERVFTCSDQDFATAMTLAGIFHAHAEYLYSTLPKTEVTRGNDQLTKFYEALPAEFGSKELEEVSGSLNISERTSYNYLSALLEIGLLEKPKKGVYRKLTE